MPTHRRRQRIEGLTLAGCGLVSAVLVITLEPSATDGPLSTLAQLAVVLVLMLVVGVRRTRRALTAARELAPAAGGTGEPTSLWKVPPIVAALTLAFGTLAGWAAALRIGAGCIVIGAVQAVVLERYVAARERRLSVRYYRVPGSRTITGSRLGTRLADGSPGKRLAG